MTAVFSQAENVYQSQAQAQAANPMQPEREIADALRQDLGVRIDPQALRIFIRTRWELLNRAAHQIHRGE